MSWTFRTLSVRLVQYTVQWWRYLPPYSLYCCTVVHVWAWPPITSIISGLDNQPSRTETNSHHHEKLDIGNGQFHKRYHLSMLSIAKGTRFYKPLITCVTRLNLGTAGWISFFISVWVLDWTRAGTLAALLFYLSVFLTVCLSDFPLSVGLTFCLSDMAGFLSACLPVCLSAWLSDILLTFWTTFVLITMLKSQ